MGGVGASAGYRSNHHFLCCYFDRSLCQEAASTADKVVAEATSTRDNVVAEAASTADEVVYMVVGEAKVRSLGNSPSDAWSSKVGQRWDESR